MTKYYKFRLKPFHPLEYIVREIMRTDKELKKQEEGELAKAIQKRLRCKVYPAVAWCEKCGLALAPDETEYCDSCKEYLHKEWSEFNLCKS